MNNNYKNIMNKDLITYTGIEEESWEWNTLYLLIEEIKKSIERTERPPILRLESSFTPNQKQIFKENFDRLSTELQRQLNNGEEVNGFRKITERPTLNTLSGGPMKDIPATERYAII